MPGRRSVASWLPTWTIAAALRSRSACPQITSSRVGSALRTILGRHGEPDGPHSGPGYPPAPYLVERRWWAPHGRLTVDDREKVLEALREGPQGARDLSRLCGIHRTPMFSLLMKMEKENLIAWTMPPSPDAQPGGDAGTSRPLEGSSDA